MPCYSNQKHCHDIKHVQCSGQTSKTPILYAYWSHTEIKYYMKEITFLILICEQWIKFKKLCDQIHKLFCSVQRCLSQIIPLSKLEVTNKLIKFNSLFNKLHSLFIFTEMLPYIYFYIKTNSPEKKTKS